MMLAVVTLHEKFSMLQVIGSVLMLGGSLVTQSKTKMTSSALPAPKPFGTVPSQQKQAALKPAFRPRMFWGYLFALGAAMCYGSSPLMARQVLPERARCWHRGRGMPRLYGGDGILFADPAQARLLGRHQGYAQ
jgi:drug/metabolite transporter (DMT)-like permease